LNGDQPCAVAHPLLGADMTKIENRLRLDVVLLAAGALCYLGCAANVDGESSGQGVAGNRAPVMGAAGSVATASPSAAGARAMMAGGVPTAMPAGSSAVGSAGIGMAGLAGRLAAAGSGGTAGQIAPVAGAGGSQGGASSAGQSGSAGAAGMMAGGAGAAGVTPKGGDACGADAMPVMMGKTSKSGNGSVTIFTSGDNEVLSASMTMLVPKAPNPTSGVVFLWPGIQPSSSGGISGYGVLQPVLTWGSSCNGQGHKAWWISGQYVYFTGGVGAKCEGGDIMDVAIGDQLDIDMSLNGNVWTQVITNRSNGKTVKFDRDLMGQKQVEVLYEIELQTQAKPSEDVIFTASVIKFSKSAPESCMPRSQGSNDYFSAVRASADGKTCCIDKVILRASGVAASSPNMP
jgi:hypothetical protein